MSTLDHSAVKALPNLCDFRFNFAYTLFLTQLVQIVYVRKNVKRKKGLTHTHRTIN